MDDAGSGYSGLNQLVNLRPDFIKLDIFLTRDIASDCVKRALATAMLGFANEVDATIIAEGAENAETVRALEVLGVDYVQGYYFGLPQPVGALPDEVALDSVGLPARRGWLDPPPDEAVPTARADRLTVASALPGLTTEPLQ